MTRRDDHGVRDEGHEEWGWPPEDETVDLLRGALHREAETVSPSPDGLTRIRAAVGVPPSTAERFGARHWLPVVAAAAAVLGVTTGGLALVNRTTPTTAVPAAFVTDQPKPPPVAPLPVYFVQKQGSRWALVREFEPTTITDPTRRLQAAVRFAVDGKALDPDYTSVWRHKGLTGEVTTIREGERLSIVLTKDLLGRQSAEAPDPALAALAVQQLVWTATAVTQLSVPVEVRGETKNARLLQGLTLDTTFQRTTGAKDGRAPVWISTLAQDQALKVGTATIAGDAVSAGGARVTWTLRHPQAPQDADPVAQGTTDLTLIGGQRGTWRITVPLPSPGRYELAVQQSWPDGSGEAWEDTKTFRVS
jgi:hypothetical protein